MPLPPEAQREDEGEHRVFLCACELVVVWNKTISVHSLCKRDVPHEEMCLKRAAGIRIPATLC